MCSRGKLSPVWLLLVPVAVYAASYAYLAVYHQNAFLLNTIVHESGAYTLLENTLYASHFLGHIPVLVTLALLFTGCCLCLGTSDHYPFAGRRAWLPGLLLLAFVAVSFVVSLILFGREDTFVFIAQQKQRVGVTGEGGSWNLHLPSTLLQLAMVPVTLFAAMPVFGAPLRPNARGGLLLGLSLVTLVGFTFLFNGDLVGTFLLVWRDPRYLAHSVRELATFPLTYYPIPLYVILRSQRLSNTPPNERHGRLWVLMSVLAVVFVVGFAFQVQRSLSAGIGDLAQKPAFAKGGRLGVPYLLASHYFEHVLDTIFFALLSLLLYGLAVRDAGKPGAAT